MTKKELEQLEKLLTKYEKEYTGKQVELGLKPLTCGYCGNGTNSPDPNVLCDKCGEDFGHAFYNEL